MNNSVRSAHAWAALLLLAAACDGGGGGDDDDKDTGTKDGSVQLDGDVDGDATIDEDAEVIDPVDGSVEMDGEVDATVETDAGEDATVGMDGETPADTGTVADTSTTPDTGSSVDTGVADAGRPNCTDVAVVAATGATITSTDGHFSLTLAGAALSGDATVSVCLVAAGSVPATVQVDKIGDVYVIESTATFTAGTARFSGHSALPAHGGTTAFNPVTVRAYNGTTTTSGTGAVLALSTRVSPGVSGTTLSATIAGPGHVYVGSLEATGVYQVDLAAPAKTAFVTGEVVDLSTIVTVGAAPVGTRTLEAELQSCNLEIMNTPISGAPYLIPQTTSITQPGCTGVYETVSRTTTNIAGGAGLTASRTIDLRAEDASPARFFCKFPGSGSALHRLLLKSGTTTDLAIEKQIEVTCTYSGDLIAVYDEVGVSPNGTTGFNAVGAPFVPRSYFSISPPTTITYETLAPDAVRFLEPTATLSTIDVGANIVGTAAAGTPTSALTNTVTAMYATDRYTATNSNAAAFFGLAAGGELTLARGTDPLNRVQCFPASAGALGLQLGVRAGAATTFAVLDSSIDVISIRVTFPAVSGPATIVQRTIDATRLGRLEAVSLLRPEQLNAVGGTPSSYAVSFYKVSWDEARRIWPGPTGRVVPVACGTTLIFEAADVL